MARTVYYCASTLDGYIAESDDTIEWLTGYSGSFEGDEVEPGPMSPGGAYERFYDQVGALISGSATYEFIVEHMGGGGSWPYSGKPYWVLSSREQAVPEAADDVRIVNAAVPEIIEDMHSAAGDKDIWVVGGGDVASQFAAAGLLDEVHVTVVPVVLGQGKPLFNDRLTDPMQLLGTQVFANGMVELRYGLASGLLDLP
jgi:dihydrofolate reductase